MSSNLPPDGKFKAGDRVRIGTWEGVLPEADQYGSFLVGDAEYGHVSATGHMLNLPSWVGPLMQIIERPKQKVKRRVVLVKTLFAQRLWREEDQAVTSDERIIWQGEIEVDE